MSCSPSVAANPTRSVQSSSRRWRLPGFPTRSPWLERVVALTAGTTKHAAKDPRLAHLVDMFALLNDTGIACGTEPDEAHDPVNKDVALKERLRLLRAAA
jgi:hypothetical protein